jgi:hypothetical protein
MHPATIPARKKSKMSWGFQNKKSACDQNTNLPQDRAVEVGTWIFRFETDAGRG